MALKDMAYTADELKKQSEKYSDGPSNVGDMPKYPWGLSMSLNQEIMKKLGIAAPAVGATMKLEAMVKVVSVSSREEADGDTCNNVELQITAMDVSANSTTADVAGKLYGGTALGGPETA